MNNEIYDDIYGGLRRKIVIVYVIGWLFVTCVELIIGFFQMNAGSETPIGVYMWRYVGIPAGIDGINIIITLLLFNSKKLSPKQKNYASIISMVLIALVLTCSHGYYYICFALFVVPLLISSVFVDRKLFIFSDIISSIALGGSAVVVYFTEDMVGPSYYFVVSVGISYLMMVIFTLILIVLLNVHEDREKVLVGLQNENARLSKENKFDGLTGLQNHTSFYNVFEHKLMKARHNKMGFALSIIDVDNFKSVNDTYGHSKGDEILKFVSDTIKDTVGNKGIVFRYGGDEFSVLFQTPNNEMNIGLLEMIRKKVEEDKSLFSDGGNVTLSIGYYGVKEVAMSTEEIFYKADQALYQAKYNGKNQVYFE